MKRDLIISPTPLNPGVECLLLHFLRGSGYWCLRIAALCWKRPGQNARTPEPRRTGCAWHFGDAGIFCHRERQPPTSVVCSRWAVCPAGCS